MTNRKIQALLINHLTKHGSVELLLPDGIKLEIGVNQLDEQGRLINVDDYCWITANKDQKMAVLDSYNLGLRFLTDKKTLVLEDTFLNEEGEEIKRLDVV